MDREGCGARPPNSSCSGPHLNLRNESVSHPLDEYTMIEPNAHYELYESRGREPDQDEQEWLRAEQEILTQQR